MRQLPVPVRWAAVTVVTIATSTGCMSIGADGGKPAPSRPAASKGAMAEPDGSTVAGTGRARTGGDAGAHSGGKTGQSGDPSPSAGPSGSPAASGGRAPGQGGHQPAPALSPAGPGVPQQPEPPAPSDPGPGTSATPQPSVPPEPDPEPSQEPPVPSASPAAQLRNNAMGPPDGPGAMRTPEASPQVGPA
ncbi:hypothetical protein OG782_19585 [Streptomyces sp. NBC_00876]|uniref:hypothetical protein n=1 Tax=Streptomyces sp. NBC_00876 TaxID=2975853 RepID=UPI0038694B55|nr:hypothetical protein OG782_19585 [Streptomyces sp. NBC_00876]